MTVVPASAPADCSIPIYATLERMILQDRGDVVPIILDHLFSDLPLQTILGMPVLRHPPGEGRCRLESCYQSVIVEERILWEHGS